ncbi:hypothetical protein H0H92_004710 [Tricholoma furcatifolium]|nr:hypothetical protein H0H92_004710 [Tricholoma furcatifolium]
MYIDLDLHFSDAVSQAFVSSNSRSPQILTLSIHHASPGFYPPSTLSSLPSHSSPTFDPYTLSIPLQAGFSSPTYTRIWSSIVRPIKDVFSPDYIVLQCGADALAGDPCGVGNLDLRTMGEVVRDVLGWGVPTMLLGGGGYKTESAARAWAYLTSIALSEPLDLESDIRDECEGWEGYGPSFTVCVARL